MREPIKVLFEHPSRSLYNPVLAVFAQIVRHIDRERFEVHIAVDREADGALRLGDGGAVISRWSIGAGPGKEHRGPWWAASAPSFAMSVAGLARYARANGIDVIHVDGTPSCGGIGLAVARLARVPLVVHLHELLGRYPGGLHDHSPARRAVERQVARHADRLVAVSRFIADDVRASGSARAPIDVVPNGVDVERFHPDVDGTQIRREYGIEEDEPLALQLGRVLASKRQVDFVRALALARRRVPNLRGLVIGWDDPGRPPGHAELRRMCADEGIGDALVIAEGRSGAPQLMAAADILVTPGLDEAAGLVALEAMASGRPVIGVRSGATPEIVLDGETGFIVPPKAPAELAARLELLATDAALRRRMGAAGRRRAETEFNAGLPAARFAPIYEELARPRSRG